ncbi:MAG: outer membrane beta-barrel protein [Lactobacillales bacterium]|jgi:opacity protein-like surface antigen|nr:outer membrane beta-barrel protein [Lactobacillales bacterium]
MSKHTLISLLCAGAILLPMTAAAKGYHENSLYISAYGGYGMSKLDQKNVKDPNTGQTHSVDLSTDGMPVGGVAIDWNVDEDIRFEISYGARGSYKVSEKSDSFYYTSPSRPGEKDYPNIKADVKTQTLLLQGYYNFGSFPVFETHDRAYSYVGAGVGAARVKSTYQLTSTHFAPGMDFVKESDTKTKPAFSILAGVTYDVTEHISIDAGLRYIYINYRTDEINSYNSLDGLIGARYNF